LEKLLEAYDLVVNIEAKYLRNT